MSDLKRKYKIDFEQLQNYMNEFDPCGFIAFHCPIDEYDYLTNKILSLLYRGESRDKIKEVILSELTEYYGEDIEGFEEPRKKKFHSMLGKFLDSAHGI